MTDREQFEARLLRRQGPTGDTPGYPGSVPFFHDQEAAAWEGWQAARAQPAQAVPMTNTQAKAVIASTAYAFDALDIVRATERHHGIVGEKGGA